MGDWIGELLAWLEPWLAYLLGLMGEGSVLGLGAAALAGVALGLSPVTYLFMPAVVGYAGGKGATRGRAAVLSLAFVLGITTVYMVHGARRALGQHRSAAAGKAQHHRLAAQRAQTRPAAFGGLELEVQGLVTRLHPPRFVSCAIDRRGNV